jgi:CheY-like chemotaxis protein
MMRSQQGTILLVEDDANDVLLVQRAFRKLNVVHPIQVVNDGEQATAYLLGEGQFANRDQYPFPVLMLLDLKLPRKAGLEVLAWLRSQTTVIRRLPVVVLTSSKQAVDINRAYDLGANSYLVKPGEFEGLLQLVKNVDQYWFNLTEKPEIRTDL